MKELLNNMSLLKMGSSKDTYPLYAQYISSDGKSVKTCNDRTFIQIELNSELPFKGNVNTFILDSVLKMLPDDYGIAQDEEKVRITAKGYKTELQILTLPFPDIQEPTLDISNSILVDSTLLDILKTAHSFTGSDLLSYIYIDKSGVCASNAAKIFMHSTTNSLEVPIGINNHILSCLAIGDTIGTDDKGNTIIKFNPDVIDGFAMFTVDSDIIDYPASKIRTFMNNTVADETLCRIDELQVATNKLSPIFFGESETFMSLRNSKGELKVVGVSGMNGRSEVIVSSQSKENLEMEIDITAFKNIPNDFMVGFDSNSTDKLYLLNDNGSEIILMGAK